jgi:hypothetical protein
VKILKSSPAILGYAIGSIREKVAHLRELGFADPVELVESLPAILGYAIGNIRGKIANLRELGFSDPVKMITSFPTILGLTIPAQARDVAAWPREAVDHEQWFADDHDHGNGARRPLDRKRGWCAAGDD